MLNVGDVNDRLVYLREEAISLAEFDHWVMSVAWNLHDKAPVGSRVYELVRNIQGVLSEYEHGEYSESEVRNELISLIRAPQVFREKVSIEAERIARALLVDATAEHPRNYFVPQLVALS